MSRLRLLLVQIRKPALVRTALALTTVGASLLATTPASGYTHKWACFVEAYSKCYDYVGSTYNHWHYVGVYGEYLANYCAKGETSSGGVIQFGCATNAGAAGGVVCTNTETHAYAYSSVRQVLTGTADTEGGC